MEVDGRIESSAAELPASQDGPFGRRGRRRMARHQEHDRLNHRDLQGTETKEVEVAEEESRSSISVCAARLC